MTGLKKALRSRRGFTLVELVVVLVIAGITASFAVPALTGYIDNAKEKQAVSETQACVMAATRIAAQKYALVQNASITGKSDGANALTSWAGELKNEAPTVTGDVALTEGSGQYLLHVNTPPAGSIKPVGISSDAGVKGTVQWMTCNASGQVLYLVYTSKDGITVVYTNNGRSSTVSTKADAVVVPTPEPGSSGGGTTGGTVTANEKQFIIHLQDIETKNSAPFANRKYHIQSGNNDFDVDSDENGDILLDISRDKDHSPRTVIGDKRTTITDAEVPDGYQVIPSDTEIYINVCNNGDNDYYLNSIQDGGNFNSGIVEMDKRRLTIMRFPVAKLELHVTDPEGAPLSGATFAIMDGSKTVAELTSGSNGECSIPVKLHEGDSIEYSASLTTGDQNNKTYVINEICPPEGYKRGFKCSFHLYYDPYPSTPAPHKKTWFYIDAFTPNSGAWGSYSLEKTVGNNDTFHIIYKNN